MWQPNYALSKESASSKYLHKARNISSKSRSSNALSGKQMKPKRKTLMTSQSTLNNRSRGGITVVMNDKKQQTGGGVFETKTIDNFQP